MPRPEEMHQRATPTASATDRWRDLALILLGEVALLLLVALGGTAWYLQLPRVLLGLVWTLYAPGYVLVAALFPRSNDLDGSERVAASFGLSWAVLPPIALLLDKLPWGLRPWPMALSLAAFCVLCGVVAGHRRSKPPDRHRAISPTRRSLKGRWPGKSVNGQLKSGGLTVLLFVLLGVLTLLVLALVVIPGHGSHVTELYLLGPQGMAADYPREVRVGEPITVTVGIVDRETSRTAFRLDVMEGERRLGQEGPLWLEPGERLEQPISFAPVTTGDDVAVVFRLYRDKETAPYRSVRLWLKVTG